MRVVACSSGCCGIKHIRDFPAQPTDRVWVGQSEGHDEDQCTGEPPAYKSWNVSKKDELKPNAGEYFVSLVKHIRERRPHGMITVNLVAYNDHDEDYCEDDADDWNFDHGQYSNYYVKDWRPILEKLGFEEQTFYNSNSGNRIHHFTLTY
jgi:hypothetical protein